MYLVHHMYGSNKLREEYLLLQYTGTRTHTVRGREREREEEEGGTHTHTYTTVIVNNVEQPVIIL